MSNILKELPHPAAMELTITDLDELDPMLKDKIVKLVHVVHDIGETDGYAKGLEAGKELENEGTYNQGFSDGEEQAGNEFECERANMLNTEKRNVKDEGVKQFKRGRIFGYRQGLET